MPLITKLGTDKTIPCLKYSVNSFGIFLTNIFVQRLIQEEKQNTEARAEELESRVGSLEHMNLGTLTRGRSFDKGSPPLSGRSTPQRDYLHKYHTVSFFVVGASTRMSTLISNVQPLILS